MNDWIPVKVQYPDKKGFYLFANGYFTPFVGFWIPGQGCFVDGDLCRFSYWAEIKEVPK